MAVPYDAILLVSFGGPEGPEDVIPFIENVTRGRDIPRDRLEEVGQHYDQFDGRSPLNDQNRALKAELEKLLTIQGPDLPVYFGNRNWHPFLADTLREMRDDGIRRALCFVTSAYSSYSGCRQYREDLAAARAEAGHGTPELDKIRVFYNHPGFLRPQLDLVRSALASLPEPVQPDARILFTTHSIPLTMARHCDYEVQHYEACRLVMEAMHADESDAGGPREWDLVFNSRSGPEVVPWLEPDVNDHLEALAARGVPAAVIVPIGFISDHMEVIYDLDVQAADTARRLRMPVARAGTVGTDPRFVAMVRELILERLEDAPARTLGTRGPSHDACPSDCCLTPGQPTREVVAGSVGPMAKETP